MKAAKMFAEGIRNAGLVGSVERIACELYGSLGHTGRGHCSDVAVVLGLEGEDPDTTNPDTTSLRMDRVRKDRHLNLLGTHPIEFQVDRDLTFHREEVLPKHSNGLRFRAWSATGEILREKVYYSVGGGFVVDDSAGAELPFREDTTPLRRPFRTGAELLQWCADDGIAISTVMLENELAWRSEAEVREGLLKIWEVMRQCVDRGCKREGILPGGLKVQRRAPSLFRKLKADSLTKGDPLGALDWVDLYALAVNEENAAGGRVVTAPTNGAAGVIPAVLHYYVRHLANADDDGVVRFLLTAGAIGLLFKENASISGAEVGCQGEVGVACSMAAAGLAEVMGGEPAQVENAAEIGMEHNLGLTCDPIGGLVQIPCIERNAMAAVKAINAARLALRGDGKHKVTLDKVIAVMRQTGADMLTKYKETARGGLAVNVIEC
jgi:L-serine dehydratase